MALRDLEANDPDMFHRLLQQNTTEILPFVYTPTVGEACQRYHELGIKTRGLYLNVSDAGSILKRLQAWPRQDIKVIVVTDGERILGLGDLGAGGMGISEGKILLYSAIGGIHPSKLLPICIDVGTNNKQLLEDPKYKGLRHPRIRKDTYNSLIEEFMQATKAWRPHVFVQFEDFANHNAFVLLERYREKYPCFNDDIQGTATIGLSGLLAAMRSSGGNLSEQKFLFFGAGEAAAGIANLIVMGLMNWHGLSEAEARERCILFDSKGVVSAERKSSLQEHKLPFAHNFSSTPPKTLLEAIKVYKPTALIGSATQPGAFNEEVIRTMSSINTNPIIFPLSNPTSKAECTFKDALEWSDGRVVFASGSPFASIKTKEGMRYAAQANNAYIFPAVGHAAVLTGAKSIPDNLLLDLAKKLADMPSNEDLSSGKLFPPFSKIREVSIQLIALLCKRICEEGLATKEDVIERSLDDWISHVRNNMYTA